MAAAFEISLEYGDVRELPSFVSPSHRARPARPLVEQTRDFPNADHDDGPDALEMALRLASELLFDRSRDREPTWVVAV